jgi:hypothetical protein
MDNEFLYEVIYDGFEEAITDHVSGKVGRVIANRPDIEVTDEIVGALVKRILVAFAELPAKHWLPDDDA